MAFITAPDFEIAAINWLLSRPGQANVSVWTGKRTVAAEPWHGKWSAHVELAPIIGQSNIRALRAFIAECDGSLNTFRVYATEGPQNANSGVTVSATAAAGATSMGISGGTVAIGDMITVNGQLLIVTNGGSGIGFKPPLRQSAAAGTKVVTSRPYALVYMTNSQLGWNVSGGQQYGISFDVEEAILETDGTVPE